MADTYYTIDGERYAAYNEGTFSSGTTWMIRWFTNVPGEDADNNFKESLISAPSTDPETAIRAAIAKGSWS